MHLIPGILKLRTEDRRARVTGSFSYQVFRGGLSMSVTLISFVLMVYVGINRLLKIVTN